MCSYFFLFHLTVFECRILILRDVSTEEFSEMFPFQFDTCTQTSVTMVSAAGTGRSAWSLQSLHTTELLPSSDSKVSSLFFEIGLYITSGIF